MSIRYLISGCRFYGLFVLLFAGLSTNPAHAAQKLFGTDETVSSNLQFFAKWTGMIDRYNSDSHPETSVDCSKHPRKCPINNWDSFISSLNGKSKREKLSEVQAFINKYRYIIDPINWGVEDYWATPRQFFIKDGDCEDYAIAKFMTLRKLGFKNDEMRVVVLNDTNLRAMHSVLVVYMDNDEFILDNQIQQVVSASQIHHYTPIYSINETNWWLHKG